MIKVFSKLLFIFTFVLLYSISALAQSGMNFQGVARNSNNVILASQPISLRLSVLKSTANGSIEYQETKTINTNAQGLFNLVIGDGTAISSMGTYSNINWQESPKFIKIEMDANAGNNFITLGTTQLQYVAYAYFANGVAAENIVGLVPVARGGTGSSTLLDLKNNLQLDKVNNTADSLKPLSKAVTLAMLAKLNNNDTVNLSNRINNKLNYADTASLSNRIDLKMDQSDGLSALVLKANASDLTTGLANKVDKVSGKGLSTNDYSNVEKTKLAAITGTNTGDQDLSSYATNTALALKANSADVNTGFSLKENISNKSTATDLGGLSPSDLSYPTQKAVKTYVDGQINSGGVTDGSILTRHIASSNITTSLLADAAITDVKIATGISKSKVGLGNVENTSDALKPISSATQTALDLKANFSDLTHTGEVTGTSFLTIANNAVTTNKIADANITYAKIQNISATNKVLGRVSTDAGIVEEISTIGTGNVVRAISPTLVSPNLVTPNIGDATATSINIGTLTTTSNYTALAINSNTKGFLPPRMTKTERSVLDGTNESPFRNDKIPTGTTIYCTDCGTGDLQIYNGVEWTSSSGDAPKSLAPGDYALGGIVGYILAPGDNGYVEGMTKGVIIDIKHIVDYDYRLALSNTIGYDPSVLGTSTALGMGMVNTNKIVTELGNYNGGNYAAKHAYDYTKGGYSDWYIPSLEELRKIRNNENAICKKLETGAISSTSPNFFITSSVGDVYMRYWAISFYGNDQTIINYSSTPDIVFDANTYFPIIMVIRSFAIGNSVSTSAETETAATIKTKLGITTLSGSNTGDQIISLSGDIAGTGTGTFTTTIGANKVTNSMLAGSVTSNKLIGTDITTVGTITTGTWSGSTIDIAKGGTGATNAAGARSKLGLVIGSDILAYRTFGTAANSSATDFIAANASITGATKTKITYDTKGLITAGADATTTDIAPSTNRNYVTDAQAGVISNTSGVNTGDETTSSIKSKLGITTLSGSNTGDQTNVSGNAGTASKLAIARKINNVDFDGSVDITVNVDAGTLTGTTLNSTVTESSLTSVGVISSGTWSATAIAVNKGGTGLTSTGTNGQVLTSTGSGTLTWTTPVFLPTIVIGTQQWMRENLDVMTYRNGDVIPQVTDATAWAGLTTGAWCYYNNDPLNGAIYGKLYNWYAVNDPRGLAPQGWHIPTDAEWTTLGTLLGVTDGLGYNWVDAGGKMKTPGITRWTTPNTSATNESGFAGLPGGYRYAHGPFNKVSEFGFWWSATETSADRASVRNVAYNNSTLWNFFLEKKYGYSVRCLRD